MEDVLDVYEMPYDESRPVVCMDEKPYQLPGEARKPLPLRPGDDEKADSEYVRNGTCGIFVFTQPLGGVRHVGVRERRTAVDWAHEIKHLSDKMYPDAQKIILVMDNLNTHKAASLYTALGIKISAGKTPRELSGKSSGALRGWYPRRGGRPGPWPGRRGRLPPKIHRYYFHD
jgi:hypothetical protein